MTRNFIIASLVMTIFSFSSCENGLTTEKIAPTPTTITAGNNSDSPKIAYFELDSVVKHYKLFTELNSIYNKKAGKVEAELEKKAAIFQNKLETYQREVNNGLMTRTKATETEQKLQMGQQELMQYRDTEFAKLKEEEMVMGNRISYNIKEFISKYNADYKYDLILSTSMSNSTVVSGNPKFNISNEIIEGLNKEYDENESVGDTSKEDKKK